MYTSVECQNFLVILTGIIYDDAMTLFILHDVFFHYRLRSNINIAI